MGAYAGPDRASGQLVFASYSLSANTTAQDCPLDTVDFALGEAANLPTLNGDGTIDVQPGRWLIIAHGDTSSNNDSVELIVGGTSVLSGRIQANQGTTMTKGFEFAATTQIQLREFGSNQNVNWSTTCFIQLIEYPVYP